MKYFITFICLLLVQTQYTAFAETEEEEMARMQKQLNNNIFGFGEEEKADPAAAHEASPAPAPVPAPVKTAATPTDTGSDNSSIPLSKFTNYKLAGLSLGKEEQAALDLLRSKGYNCNIQQMSAMIAMMGKKICVYISTEDPKMAMIGFSGGKLRDLETHETYTTGFPEKFFKKAKAKFIKTYGTDANCKTKGKGEICEVFGHGYRVLFRTEMEGDDKAKIINRIAKM